MATLHGDLPKAGSELRLAHACKQLPDAWHLFFNVHWVYRDDILHAELPGEADAVLYHRDHGVALIEVKGGGIQREGERWFSIDGHRRWHPIQSPLDQASHGVYAFRRSLKALAKKRSIGQPEAPAVPRIEPMVCFPDIPPLPQDENPFGEDLPRRLILDHHDLETLEERLIAVLAWPSPWTHRPAPDGYHLDILQLFHPVAQSVPLLRDVVRAEEALYARANADQVRLLDALRENPRLLVSGAAGTGKTTLAIAKARDLAARGKRVLYLCQNPLLAERLETLTDLQAVEVDSREHFLGGFLRKAGLEDEEGTLLDRFCQSLEMQPELRWDALVCDEAEHFPDAWWPVLGSLLKDPANGPMVLFRDPSALPARAEPVYPAGLARCRLDRAVRCTRTIAQWIASHTGRHLDLEPGCPFGEPVREKFWATPAEQEKLLKDELHRLMQQERLEPGQIAVLSAKTREASALSQWKDPRLKWVARIGGWNRDKAPLLPLDRISAVEADAVILVDVDPDTSAETLYAMSARAKHLLIVLMRR
jgi:DNA polymerase III delta prime subunit